MYTLSDLSSLDLTELKAIATSMDITKIDDLSQDDLIYTILDQQAINSSKASAANVRKKRTTKAKNKAAKGGAKNDAAVSDETKNNGGAADNSREAADDKNKPVKAPADSNQPGDDAANGKAQAG